MLSLKWLPTRHPIGGPRKVVRCTSQKRGVGGRYKVGSHWLTYVFKTHAAAAKSLQSCPTLCDPIDGSPPGFPIPGILQARTLEWVAISFSNA